MMKHVHGLLISIVERIQSAHIVLFIKEVTDKRIILNIWNTLCNVECAVLSEVFRHAVLVLNTLLSS